MRQHFEISRASEYFDPEELTKRTGMQRNWWPEALLKELMDNALDITDGLDGEIEIRATPDLISVWDSGSGMSTDLIKKLLVFDSRTSDKFAYQGPTRGQQGNAFKTFLGIAYNLGGHVEIESQGLKHTIHCNATPAGGVDVDHHVEEFPCPGTRITVHSVVALDLTGFGEWVFNYHLANPFVQITYFSQDVLAGKDGETKPLVLYKSGSLDKIKTTDHTSIHWYDQQKFKALCFLQAGVENIPLGQFIGSFDGLKTSKKKKAISDGFPDLKTIAKDDELSAELLQRMKNSAREIKPKKLGLIGEKTLVNILTPDRHWYKKTCGVHDGKPWCFEVMVAECERIGKCYAVNHSIAFSSFCTALLSDDWLYEYGFDNAVSEAGADTALVFVHFIGISPEFSSLGKDSINFPDEIKAGISRQTRLAFTTLYKEERRRNRAESWTLPQPKPEVQMSLKDAVRQVLPAAVLKATDNETIPANKRGLYYATRDMVQALTDAELNYNYFGDLLTKYWHEVGGRHPLIYYDPRGILYEPHSHREIPLGTKDVLAYSIPEYRYNKILYIEKKGIWPAIESARLAQEYDMAVIAAEGFATEAARALMQEASDQDYIIFVFHDADPAGYEIARTISEATKTMPNNNISIVDLGLDIETCVEMELSAETFSRKKALPSGQNFSDIELEYFEGVPHVNRSGKTTHWTGCRRIEINAMGSREMVNYLDHRIGVYLDGDNKVIPPDDVQREEAEAVFADKLEELAKDHYDEKIQELTDKLKAEFSLPENRGLEVVAYLEKNKYDTWGDGVEACISTFIGDLGDEIKDEIGNFTEGDKK